MSDLERLRDNITAAVEDAAHERTHPDLDSGILDFLLAELRQLTSGPDDQPTSPKRAG